MPNQSVAGEESTEITQGSGNVFADLGLPDAESLKIAHTLWYRGSRLHSELKDSLALYPEIWHAEGLQQMLDQWSEIATRYASEIMLAKTEPIPEERAGREEAIEVRRYEVDICIPCINLSGDECHTPGCIFFLCSISEVSRFLDRMLIRPIIDGEQYSPLQEGAPIERGNGER